MINIYLYDNERNIMTDGQRWFMYYKTAEKFINNFEKVFQDYQKYGKKSWAPGELRDFGTKVETQNGKIIFHTDGYSRNCQRSYIINQGKGE